MINNSYINELEISKIILYYINKDLESLFDDTVRESLLDAYKDDSHSFDMLKNTFESLDSNPEYHNKNSEEIKIARKSLVLRIRVRESEKRIYEPYL